MNEPRCSPIGELAQIGRGLLMGDAEIIAGVWGRAVGRIRGIHQRLVTTVSHFHLRSFP